MLKDIYTEDYLRKQGLNERQVKAVFYVKEKGNITNAEYQKLNNIGKTVTLSELQNLVEKDILDKIGKTGRGTKYILKNGR